MLRIITVLMILSSFSAVGQRKEKKSRQVEAAEVTYVSASFPGGMEAFGNYVMEELGKTGLKPVSGNLLASIEFVISKEGKVTEVKVTSLNDPQFIDHLIRIFQSSPLWNPRTMKVPNTADVYLPDKMNFPIEITFE